MTRGRPSRTAPVAVLRAGWGALLLIAPGAPLIAIGARPVDRRARAFGRALGARQLAEAALLDRAGPLAVAAGAGVDALHALTVAGLAAADPRRRRAASANAAIALGFAAEGAARARRLRGG